MLKRLSLGLVSTSVLAAALSPLIPMAEASTPTAPSHKRGVTLTSSATDVEEGGALKLTAKLKKGFEPGSRVTLQRWNEDDWEDVDGTAR